MIDETLQAIYKHVLLRGKELDQFDEDDITIIVLSQLSKNSPVFKRVGGRTNLFANPLVCVNKLTGQSNLLTRHEVEKVLFASEIQETLKKVGIK